jgi:tight adherence protein C
VTSAVVVAPAMLTAVLGASAVATLGTRRASLPVLADAARPVGSLGARWLTRVGSSSGLRRVAGIEGGSGAERTLGVTVAVGVVGTATLLVAPFPLPLLAPLMLLLAVRAPRWILARSGRSRRAGIDREVTQFLDALAAASTAGLSAPLGIRRAATVVVGPLRDELDRSLRAVDLGARWRDELRSLADRSGVADLRRAVAVITRTETLGSSLAASTIELADRVRAGRRQRATERARTAPVKMLFPLVFLVLPAFLLLTVVPVLLTTLQSIR